MLRVTRVAHLRATVPLLVWTADPSDTSAPDTTFKNVKPGLALRWWRQFRQRWWEWWIWDEEWRSWSTEGFQHTSRMEQIAYFATGSYGSVPGSYSDPILYNTKTTSPLRWHSHKSNFETRGNWVMEIDEILRVKQWVPKNPGDPFEMFPRPPNFNLDMVEDVDEHGNRHFKYKYRYDIMDPHKGCYQAYPFNHHYSGQPDGKDRVEPYGFKQGHLLRCDAEEEEILRRIMEEETREWEMIKGTELVQEPWSHPGKIRPKDLHGSVDRAKARWRQAKKEGRPTDPSKDPDYDLAMSSEYVEPRDGPRADWKHLWSTGKPRGQRLPYASTGNYGGTLEEVEDSPPAYPGGPRDPEGTWAEQKAKRAAARAAESAAASQTPVDEPPSAEEKPAISDDSKKE
jgi:hypothetical protein